MDLHKNNAAKIFGVTVEEVTLDQRLYAKQCLYFKLYSRQGFLESNENVKLCIAANKL